MLAFLAASVATSQAPFYADKARLLAVIDDDGAEGALVGFERELGVGVQAISRVQPHGSLMAAWAVGLIFWPPVGGEASP